MKISELILMLQQISNQDATIKVSLQNRPDELVEYPVGGLLEPSDRFKDWSVFAMCDDNPDNPKGRVLFIDAKDFEDG